MPIYTYICKDCSEEFDLLVGVVSGKTELKCKKCGSSHIEKTFAPFGVNVSSRSNNLSSSGPSCPTGTCPL
ncbi:unnamed protein product [marine sediment metagenome]|uniref:Putative regulatory protein FmdB zinc ribbon domain-containing protein n=1 Tax=marine sediment metagenome TaxID=412755 RepID=X0U4F4_9ZZZZ